jgi:hypothetical protein
VSHFSDTRDPVVKKSPIFSEAQLEMINNLVEKQTRTIVAEILRDRELNFARGQFTAYKIQQEKRAADPTSRDYFVPNPRPLPPNLQSMTVSEPTVVVSGPCTFYGYAESGNARHYADRLRISDTNDATDRWSAFGDPIRDIISLNYGTMSRMVDSILYFYWRKDKQVAPPSGQTIMPLNYGLSILRVPEGVTITVYYTVP